MVASACAERRLRARRCWIAAAAGALAMQGARAAAQEANVPPATQEPPAETTPPAAEPATPPATEEAPAAPPAPAEVAQDEPAAPDEPNSPPAEANLTEEDGFDVRGSFLLRWRWRDTKGATDSDLDALLVLDAGDADVDPLALHVVARSAYDLNGTDHDGAYAFDSLSDTYDERLTAQLYEAWIEGRGFGPIGRYALGRYRDLDTPIPLSLDGARIETPQVGIVEARLGAWAGVPVHYFESSPEGDVAYGAWLDGKAWESGRLRFDALHVEDEARFTDQEEDLVAASLWQDVGQRLQLFGRATWLESRSRDWTARATFFDPESTWRFNAAWYELLHAQRDLSLEFDPFFEAALDHEPYRQLSVSAAREFGERFGLAAGADVRRLRNDSDEGEFNREFERFWLTPSVSGWPGEGTELSLSAEWWSSPDDSIATLGADVSQELTDDVVLRGGTSYARWKYDLFLDRELDRVRTWYAQIDWRLAKQWKLRADWSWEKDAFDRYHTFRMAATWTF